MVATSAKAARTSRCSGLLSGWALLAQMSRKRCAMSEPSSGTAQLAAGQVVGLASRGRTQRTCMRAPPTMANSSTGADGRTTVTTAAVVSTVGGVCREVDATTDVVGSGAVVAAGDVIGVSSTVLVACAGADGLVPQAAST